MRKVRIGILPSSRLFKDDNPYNDQYIFVNNYCKRISDAEAIPVGILLNDGKLDIESLEMCDAFLIPGGGSIEDYLLACIDYAVIHNKPLLGLCLGMQAIGVYSFIKDRILQEKREVNKDSMSEIFKQIKEEKIQFLKPVEGHYNSVIGRENFDENIHSVKILEESRLYQIYGKKQIDALSMHSYALNVYGEDILVSAKDNEVIEGVEFKNKDLFIVGVQFHAEVEDKHSVLFESLVKAARSRL